MSIRRRTFIKAAGASGLALGLGGFSAAGHSRVEDVQARLRGIETRFGGTLGAEILDLGSGAAVGHNRDERFGHASSFKLSLAAMVLARDSAGIDDADRHVRWSEDDLMFVSPFTTQEISKGASLRELARATQITSDNAAANILLREVGGPSALTRFWRSIGDEVSRLDRNEPSVNLVPPGEIRDTTTPAAMARTVAQLVYGTALPQAERAMLKQWMVDTGTGRRRVRAGLPDGWLAGDKTGTGLTPQTGGTYIDIGFVEPPETSPLVFAAYYRPAGTDSSFDRAHEAPLKQVGEVLADFARMQG